MPSSASLLDDMKRAAAEAAEAFKASCETNFPLTPPGRLAAMTNRLDATLQAVRIVRPRSKRSTTHCRTSRRRASPLSVRTTSAKIARAPRVRASNRTRRLATGEKAGPHQSADRAHRRRREADPATARRARPARSGDHQGRGDSGRMPARMPFRSRRSAGSKRWRSVSTRWCRPARPCSRRWRNSTLHSRTSRRRASIRSASRRSAASNVSRSRKIKGRPRA